MEHAYKCVACDHEWTVLALHGTSPWLIRRCECGGAGYIQPPGVGGFYGLTVESAAICVDDTLISVEPPAGHAEAIRKAIRGGYAATLGNIESGFVLSNGDFVDRRLAAHVAWHAGQTQKKTRSLTSQDIWS